MEHQSKVEGLGTDQRVANVSLRQEAKEIGDLEVAKATAVEKYEFAQKARRSSGTCTLPSSFPTGFT